MNDLVEKAIEFVDVHFSDQQVAIIKGITGYIEKGKIMTLVGPSGAGKTTIFKLINGLALQQATMIAESFLTI